MNKIQSNVKMKPLKIKYLNTLFLVCSIIASAQDYIDLAKLDYAITPTNTFENSAVTTKLYEMNGNLTLPIVINDNFAFLTGATYDRITAAFDAELAEESVTGLTLKIGANVKHNSKWSGTYMLLPKYASGLEKITSRDFQLGAIVLMKYTKTDHFNSKFGLYGNSELFGPFIVPLFGFYYLNPSKTVEVNALLPLSIDFNYSTTKDLRFGLNFKGQVSSYAISTPTETDAKRYLEKSVRDLYTYVQYETKNGLNFQLGFGRSIGRSYRIYNEKVSLGLPLFNFGDSRTQLNADFSDSWLFKATVFYRFGL